jgi:hypothetical protein
MAFIPATNTVEIEIRGLLDDQQVENTLYFQADNPIDDAAVDDLMSVFSGWVGSEYPDQKCEAYKGTELLITDLTTESGLQRSVDISYIVGSVEGSALPNNSAFAVSFRTGLRGRSYRGRNYAMAIPISAQEGINQVTTAYRDAVVGNYANLLELDFSSVGWTWVVVSRFLDNAPRSIAEVTPVTSVIATDLTLDSQRRRLPGRGR